MRIAFTKIEIIIKNPWVLFVLALSCFSLIPIFWDRPMAWLGVIWGFGLMIATIARAT
jgi:hypothetical protein